MNAQELPTACFMPWPRAMAAASTVFLVLFKSFLHACAPCATHRALAIVSAMLRSIACLVAASPEGDSQSHLLVCPVLRLWVDLRSYSGACSASTSVGALLRCLAAPAPDSMRAAVTVDMALWRSDRLRHGTSDRPRALCSARLKELAMWHTDCRRAIP